MKIEMLNYGTKFNLHCPRCGNDEWSEKTYSSGKDKHYHKCLHCGADVRNDEHTEVVIVIEQPFAGFTANTYNEIEKVLDTDEYWKVPEVA